MEEAEQICHQRIELDCFDMLGGFLKDFLCKGLVYISQHSEHCQGREVATLRTFSKGKKKSLKGFKTRFEQQEKELEDR